MREHTTRAIRRKFRAIARGDNMPIAVKRGTRNDLADLWGELEFAKGVEIGVGRARFSQQILSRTDAHLTCVDIWQPYEHSSRTIERQARDETKARERLAEFGDRVAILKISSMQAVAMFEDNELDFVFIDADHTFDHAAPDIIFWSRKVHTGGIVAVHDYHAMRLGGVVKAVDAYTHCHAIVPWYVTKEIIPTAFWVKP